MHSKTDSFDEEWKPVGHPSAFQLAGLLTTQEQRETCNTFDLGSSYFYRLSKPHRNFFTKYLEQWTNGSHYNLIKKYVRTVCSDYPLQLVHKCVDKIKNKSL